MTVASHFARAGFEPPPAPFTLPEVAAEAGMTDLARAALDHGYAESDRADPCHDRGQLQLVYRYARGLAVAEGRADLLTTVSIGAALQGVAAFRQAKDPKSSMGAARSWLVGHGADAALADQIAQDLVGVRFLGAATPTRPLSPAGQIVQDASRLPALGANGIARAFTYGGSIGRAIYDPSAPVVMAETAEEYLDRPGTSTVAHFFEKLLLIADRLHTDAARNIAAPMHEFMVTFLAQLNGEWGQS